MIEYCENLEKDPGCATTLNKMGYSFDNLTEYGDKFIEFSGSLDKPVLDVAAAYGVATLRALAKGAYVYANDLDIRHLEILKDRVPLEQLERLALKPGKFPGEIDFPINSLGAILVSQLWHFLSGDEIIESIHKMYHWLSPGGKVFIITGSPYIQIVKDFLPTFYERKKQGLPWPGFIEDISIYHHQRAKDLPKSMNYMDDEIILNLFRMSPFVIEQIGFISRPDFPEDMRLDGREQVGVILRKE